MHVIHKPNPIPLAEINTSQIEARELRRKMMGNYAEEGVDMVTKKMDEDRKLPPHLSEETYLASLELMKERYHDVKRAWEQPDWVQSSSVILNYTIWLAIEAEAKRQSETTNP